MRLGAIWCCLWFGLRPWWLYEDECHYSPMSYREHLKLNLSYAWIWLRFRETEGDRAFEREVNAA